MSSYSVEDLIDKFNQRKLKNKKATPYSIFLEVNGTKIYSDMKIQLGGRPNLPDVRLKFKEVWNMTSVPEKSKYESAALRLGYLPLSSKFSRDNTSLRNRIDERLRKIQESK